jgi:hypothetical protein
MNKKIMAVAIALLIAIPQSAEASRNSSIKNNTDSIPTLAILDTGLDTSLPIFSGKIVHEVCMIGWSTCPNGSGFQEGVGSAVIDPKFITSNGFEHGTQMTSIAVQRNPNMNIVFIRIVGHTSDGRRQIIPDSTISSALDWVLKNKEKYNIKAVSMAQGSMSRNTKLSDYCVKIPTVTASIDALSSSGVPVFLSAGNDRIINRINWPACIPSAIAVSATDQRGEVTLYTNYDPLLTDFFSQGNITAMLPGGKVVNVAGTSASVQTAAADWISLKSAKPALSYAELYNLIIKTSKLAPGAKIKGARLFDLAGAINGQ